MKTVVVSLLSFLLPGLPFQKKVLLTPIPQSELINQVADREKGFLAQNSLDLTNRDENKEINEIFTDNILLNLYYFAGKISDDFSFVLPSGAVFAFHKNILPEYEKGLVMTVGSQFSAEQGFKKAYGIHGNGVCHLASLMNWTASEAGLEVIAKRNHDFSPIPGVPREYGTLISYEEGSKESKEKNLYIKNNFDFPVIFQFKLEKKKIKLRILKLQ